VSQEVASPLYLRRYVVAPVRELKEEWTGEDLEASPV